MNQDSVQLPQFRFGRALLSWKQVAKERIRLLRLLRWAGKRDTTWLLVWHSLSMLTAPMIAVATGWLVSEVTGAVETRAATSAILLPLIFLICLFVVDEFAESLAAVANRGAAGSIDGRTRRQVRQIALAPWGIMLLEESSFQEDVKRASDPGRWRGSVGAAAVGQLVLTYRMIGALIGAAVIATFSVPLAAALLAISLVMRSVVRRQWTYMDLPGGNWPRPRPSRASPGLSHAVDE